jgi:hypothetical protein
MDMTNLPPAYNEDDFFYECVNSGCEQEGLTYTVSSSADDAFCPFCDEEMALIHE